jgi:hypothetical protein
MKTMSSPIARWIAAVCLIAGTAAAQIEGTITTKDNRAFPGQLKWKAAGRLYEIRQASGAIVTLTLDKVATVKVKTPPAGLDGLIKNVQTGAGGAAIPGLEQIVKTYEMLEYDLTAARWLCEALVKGGKATEAVRVCDEVAQYRPKSWLTMEFVKVYWDALQADRQYPKLESEISGAIAEGARDVAAVAQNKRGDMKMEKKEFKEALVDGYLRTVVLFTDVKSAQPAALYQAALCFDQLGQAIYAERMRKKLLEDFPQDPYADKLKSGGG